MPDNEVTIDRLQVYLIPIMDRKGNEIGVEARANVGDQVYKPGSRSQRVQARQIYDGGIFTGMVTKGEISAQGPKVDAGKSFRRQAPVFETSIIPVHRWLPINGGRK